MGPIRLNTKMLRVDVFSFFIIRAAGSSCTSAFHHLKYAETDKCTLIITCVHSYMVFSSLVSVRYMYVLFFTLTNEGTYLT